MREQGLQSQYSKRNGYTCVALEDVSFGFALLSKAKAKINQNKHCSFYRFTAEQPSCNNNKSHTAHSSFFLL